MRNLKLITKFVSIILAVVMVFSALPTFGVFANAEADPTVGSNYQNNVKVSGRTPADNDSLFSKKDISLVKTLPSTYELTVTDGKAMSYEGWGDFIETESDAGFLYDCDIENKKYQHSGDNHFMGNGRKFAVKKQKYNEETQQMEDVKYTNDKGEVAGTEVDYFQINGEYAVDIVHDLEKEESVKKIVISHHTTLSLRAGHYYLFASTNKEDLFKAENIVKKVEYEYVNTLSQIFEFEFAITARYVAIRVFNPYNTNDEETLRKGNAPTRHAGNAYIRMFEFNVFGAGNEKVESRDYPYTVNNATYEYNDELAKNNNLIKGHVPEEMYFVRNGEKYDAFAKLSGVKTSSKVFTDGDSETAAEVRDENNSASIYRFSENNALLDDETKMYFQMNYKLDGVAKVSDLELMFHYIDALAASHIKVSVADTAENLFKKGVAASYTTADIYSAFGNLIKVRFDSPKQGQYVGIRVICPVRKYHTNVADYYVRLTEVSIYGNYISTVGAVNCNYKIEGTTQQKAGNIEIVYTGNPDSNGKYTVGTKVTIKAPASIRDNSDVLHSFLRWESGKEILGEDIVHTMELENTGETNIFAIYGTSDKKVEFAFLDYFGNTIHTATVPFGQYISRSDYEAANEKLGDVPGMELSYSEFSFGSRVATVPEWNQDIYNYAADADTTFTPIYKPADKTYTVTLDGASQGSDFIFDQYITFTRAAAKYWTVNGVEWCEGNTFTAYVTEDMDIKAVTTGETTREISLAANPVITGSSLGFAAKMFVSPTAEADEYGLLLVNSEPASEGITLSSAQQRIEATKCNANGEFMVTVTNMPRKVTRWAVAYVTKGGETFYSNVVKVTMP